MCACARRSAVARSAAARSGAGSAQQTHGVCLSLSRNCRRDRVRRATVRADGASPDGTNVTSMYWPNGPLCAVRFPRRMVPA